MDDVSSLLPSLPTTDLSKKILDGLFGLGWDEVGKAVITGDSVDAIGFTGSANMIMDMFFTLNSVAMSIGAAMILWTFMQGAIGTSHEGQFLGKRFHSIWAPIRSGVSVAMMAPIGGISALQAILLIFIGLSVSSANTLWCTGLDFIGKNAGQAIIVVPESIKENTRTVANGILKSTTIQAYESLLLDKYFSTNAFQTSPWIEKGNGKGGYQTITFAAPTNSKLRPKDLGEIKVSGLSPDDPLFKTRLRAVKQMIVDIMPLSKSIIACSAEYIEDELIDPNLYKVAIDNYNNTIKPKIGAIIAESDGGFTSDLQDFVTTAKAEGWVAAGAYYWTISRYTEKKHENITNTPEYLDCNLRKISYQANSQLSSALAAMGQIDQAAYLDVNDSIDIARANSDSWTATTFFQDVVYWIFGKQILNRLVNGLSEGDPISNLSSIGHFIIGGCETAFFGGLYLYTTAKGAEAGSDSWAGKLVGLCTLGATNAAISGGAKTITFLVTIVTFILVPLFIFGFMLAFYLPSLPFILWMSAVIGWIIMVIETMAAAPLWAIAHSLPEGEGIGGQHGKTGYMMMLGILVRPPLMIVGFVSAVIIMGHIGHLVAHEFKIFTGSMTANHVFGPVSMVCMLIIIGTFIVVIAHKVFGLITHLPEKVTGWIGQTVSGLGEAADESRTRAIFAGFASKGEGVGSNAMGAVAGKNGSKNDKSNKSEVDPEDSGGGTNSDHEPGDASAMSSSIDAESVKSDGLNSSKAQFPEAKKGTEQAEDHSQGEAVGEKEENGEGSGSNQDGEQGGQEEPGESEETSSENTNENSSESQPDHSQGEATAKNSSSGDSGGTEGSTHNSGDALGNSTGGGEETPHGPGNAGNSTGGGEETPHGPGNAGSDAGGGEETPHGPGNAGNSTGGGEEIAHTPGSAGSNAGGAEKAAHTPGNNSKEIK